MNLVLIISNHCTTVLNYTERNERLLLHIEIGKTGFYVLGVVT